MALIEEPITPDCSDRSPRIGQHPSMCDACFWKAVIGPSADTNFAKPETGFLFVPFIAASINICSAAAFLKPDRSHTHPNLSEDDEDASRATRGPAPYWKFISVCWSGTR